MNYDEILKKKLLDYLNKMEGGIDSLLEKGANVSPLVVEAVSNYVTFFLWKEIIQTIFFVFLFLMGIAGLVFVIYKVSKGKEEDWMVGVFAAAFFSLVFGGFLAFDNSLELAEAYLSPATYLIKSLK